MTDEEFAALQETYRRAGDAWRTQLDTVRRAQEQANRLNNERQELASQINAEFRNRHEQNTAEIRRRMQGVTGLDEEVAQMRGRD